MMLSKKTQRADYILICIVFGILTTLLNYAFGNNDQLEQLPIIYRFIDPDYLTNDFFVNSNAGYSPRYFYAISIAFLSSFVTIPTLFLMGTLLSNISVSILTFLCGNLLFDNKKAGIIASGLIMGVPTISLGSSLVLHTSQFNPTTLVFPLVLLAFYFLLKRKIVYCLLTTGVISIFHILIGFEYGILFLGIALLLDIIEKKSWKEIAKKASLIFVVFAFLLPNLIPYYQNKITIDSALFIDILANFRHPHHYILSHILDLKEVLKLVAFLIISFIVFKEWKTKSKRSSNIVSIVGIILALCIFLNWMFTEVIPVKLFTSLQLLRMLDIGKWIFILLFANYFATFINKKQLNLKFFISLVLLFLLFYFSKTSNIKIAFLVLLYSFFILVLFKEKRTLLVLASFLSIGFFLIINNLDHPRLQKHQKSYFASQILDASKNDLSTFIQKNTGVKSMFLVPHDFGFLRTETKRAIVVDFKAFPFQEDAMLEWYHRVKDCYGDDKNNFENHYTELDDEKILNLKDTYLFDYAILYEQTQTNIPVIYSNLEYKIIDLTAYVQ